jgi:tellurite resistance protein TerC
MAEGPAIAGVPLLWWVGFHLVCALLLVTDSLVFGGRQKGERTALRAWAGTAFLVAAATAFAFWINLVQGRQPALEFVAGYTVEISLSIDNLFVFMILFQGFGVGPRRQRRALLWGIGGAVVLRGLFIVAGLTLLAHFRWISWVFGLLLLYAAFRLVRGGSAAEAVPGWVRRLHTGKSSLLPVIVAVELTDLLFAVDSIPAVLAVSHHLFVVYTSNIAAILGLRSLYFALSSLLDRLRYLHYGLGVLLAFVAFKMLAGEWLEIPITVSLAVMGGILAVCALVSVLAAGPHAEPKA